MVKIKMTLTEKFYYVQKWTINDRRKGKEEFDGNDTNDFKRKL